MKIRRILGFLTAIFMTLTLSVMPVRAADAAEFTVTTTADTGLFSFNIGSAGEFTIDWGDGSAVETITKNDAENTTYTHDYTTTTGAGTYKIGISGQASAYNSSNSVAAISFRDNTNVAGIAGSLGAIFGTLENGTNPRFRSVFDGCTNLTGEIPADLFAGISGEPKNYMFYNAFAGCEKLTGSIPADLFAGVIGAPVTYMFYRTFYGCSGLSGEIPADLFAGISGEPKSYMFYRTFYGCSGLEGSVPSKLFAGITGDGASNMFNSTFGNCSNLTGYVDGNMFTVPAGTVTDPYANTFKGADGMYTECPADTTAVEKPDPNWTVAVCSTGDDTGTGDGGDNETDTPTPSAEFTVTTTPDTTSFKFYISAAGTFAIDWGDGTVETFTKDVTGGGNLSRDFGTMYSHTYSTAKSYKIGISGQATAYNAQEIPVVSFSQIIYSTGGMQGNKNVAGISGSLGAIFGTLSDGTNPRFDRIFSGCSNLTGSIPAELFAGISGAPADEMFYSTFYGCSGLTGSIPADLFAGIKGAPADHMFYYTFGNCSNLTGSIPADLFAGIKGVPARNMFSGTFSGCSNLSGSIPVDLFAGISGAPAEWMFYSTFKGCKNLTGEIPSDLFAGIKGVPAKWMFSQTFDGCSKLSGSIPAELFVGISGAPASDMFYYTFEGCSGLSGSIPVDLFAGIKGAQAGSMFMGTFSGCSNLSGSIPVELFAGIKGAPASDMFWRTFYGCLNLSGSIPADLFKGISGKPAGSMFHSTFSGCSGLSGSIPVELFAGIKGAPAQYMFAATFEGCNNLTGEIPADLFAGISGAPAAGMFGATFDGCSNLSGEIPTGLFGELSGTAAAGMFAKTFRNCSNLTGYVDGNMFTMPAVDAEYNMQYCGWGNYNRCPTYDNTFYNASKMDKVCPAGTYAVEKPDPDWTVAVCTPCPDGQNGPNGEVCIQPLESEFTVTTTPDTTSFKFYISAAGTFTIDWGDGTVDTINKTNTNKTTYSHTYSSAGAYEIGISGQATAYKSDLYTAAISFNSNKNVAGISGTLGAIFGTLENGTQPRFYQTFYGCSGLSGSIPSDLFAGISGAPADNMFFSTFFGCSNLTGSIPADLFAGIKGAPAQYMFAATFDGCKNLTGEIPADLFAGIKGAPAEWMFYATFLDCSNLTGSIPAELFAGISGAPARLMFYSTFSGCLGLTGYVDGNMFTVPAGDVSDPYSYTFPYASKMDKVCPANTYAVAKHDSSWSVAVCSKCPDGLTSPENSQSIDACVPERCAISLRTRTGVTIPTYPTRRTVPSIAVSYGDDMCYIDVETNKRGKYIIRAESR